MESKFNGGLLGLIGVSILQALISVFTLGIGVPWALCMKEDVWLSIRRWTVGSWCLTARVFNYSVCISNGSCFPSSRLAFIPFGFL